MKRPAILLSLILLLLLAAGTVFGNAAEQAEPPGRKYYGVVVSRPEGQVGRWKVAGRTVDVSKDTVIVEQNGKAEIGAFVEVTGRKVKSVIRALRIEVKLPAKKAG